MEVKLHRYVAPVTEMDCVKTETGDEQGTFVSSQWPLRATDP